jgi:lysozyme
MLDPAKATWVVDISHYESVTDWNQLKKANVHGVICKATEGPGMVDITFARRYAQAKTAGLLFGAYHFLRPGSVGQQSHHFLGNIPQDDKILLALDHEDPKVPLENALEWVRQVQQQTGRWPILYSGFLIKEQLQHIQAEAAREIAKNLRLWLAEYGPHPVCPPGWDKPFLWQFTGDGEGPAPHAIPGIIHGGKGIDISAFDGSPAELEKAWA